MKTLKFTKYQNEILKILTKKFFECNTGFKDATITPGAYMFDIYEVLGELHRCFGTIEPFYSILWKEYEIQTGNKMPESRRNTENSPVLSSYCEEFRIYSESFKRGVMGQHEFSQNTIDILTCVLSAFGQIEPYYSEFKRKAEYDPLMGVEIEFSKSDIPK